MVVQFFEGAVMKEIAVSKFLQFLRCISTFKGIDVTVL